MYIMSSKFVLQVATNGKYLFYQILGLSDYRDSTRHRDSLGLFTIVIVDCLTI